MLPKPKRNRHRVDINPTPPYALVALPMKLTMMQATQRDRKLVRNPAAECTRLSIANVVSLAGLASANRTGLKRNESEMIFIARPAQLQYA
jgi:hypothetical protein